MFCPETSIRRAKTHNTLIYNKLHNQPQNSECKEILHLCKVVLQFDEISLHLEAEKETN